MASIWAASLVGSIALWLGMSSTAGAQTQSNFQATAGSESFDALISNPAVIPLGEPVEVAGTDASALLDSIGDSTGFAAAPYPGDLVNSLPGLAAGAFGIPLPSYPLVVTSNAPGHPTATLNGPGGYNLSASSADQSSTASASLGAGDNAAGAGTLSSSATIKEQADGSVVAVGDTSVAGFSLAGVISLGTIHSTATATQDSTGNLKLSSSSSVDALSILGLNIGLENGSLVLAGQSVPLPPGFLNNLLSPYGVSIQYVSGVKTATSITSAALLVTVTEKDPTGKIPGTNTIKFRLGEADASLQGSVLPAVESPNPTSNPISANGSSVGSTPTSGPISMSSPLLPTSSSGTESPSPAGTSSGAAVQPSASPVEERAPLKVSLLDGYLALAVGILLVGIAAFLIRTLGVKALWTS
jgi:hypothetical protein